MNNDDIIMMMLCIQNRHTYNIIVGTFSSRKGSHFQFEILFLRRLSVWPRTPLPFARKAHLSIRPTDPI